MAEVLELECPGCGRPLSTDMRECPACHRPVVISSLSGMGGLSTLEINKYANAYQKALTADPNNKQVNGALAMCFLKLKLYDKALAAFDKAIIDNFENSEVYFWAAVALLRGKKAFVTPRPDINKAEEYLNAAIMIEPKGIYYYLFAYIRYDFHARKFLRCQPNYQELLQEAVNNGVTPADIDQLFSTLNVEIPPQIALD
jgi:tetratricopeptide (TPR) repeat protein